MASTRIIIIGGGFAGVKCASTLRHLLSPDAVEIVVFARENHMVFDPLLAEVASATVSPKDMAAPLRELLPHCHIRREEVIDIRLDQGEVEYAHVEGSPRTMKYDHLVIASGNTTNLAFIPGMADHAFALKSVGDALSLQSHVIGQLERAEICDDPERRKWHLNFVIVGGGFSGVELAGEINDLVKRSARYYTNFTKEDVTVTLVHSRDQILPEVGPKLREFALKEMEKHGVKFILNSSAAFCTPTGVGIRDGKFLSAGTVVCTIGSRALPMIERLDLPKDRGRIIVQPDMSLPGYKNAWAIGDCAAVKNAVDNEYSPTTGQFAERQGAQAAQNINKRLKNEETKPFSHQSLGTLCSIGGKKAVAEMMDMKVSGFPAWIVWRGVYLIKLPSFVQKVKVAISWLFDLFMPPALTTVSPDSGSSIGNAHYKGGDFIYKHGDPASDFFVIQNGEVEIISACDGNEQVIAVLTGGDFFGESSLAGRECRNNHARAREDVELLVMGKHIFDQVSTSLSPFRDALANAMKRRTSIWQDFPELQEVVRSIPLKELIEDLPSEPLGPEDSLMDAVTKINKARLDFVFVVDDKRKLLGLVTRSDILKAIEMSAANTGNNHHDLLVKDFLEKAPVVVTAGDDTLNAVSMMRDAGFKRIPVVENSENQILVGNLRIENIMERVLRSLQSKARVATPASN